MSPPLPPSHAPNSKALEALNSLASEILSEAQLATLAERSYLYIEKALPREFSSELSGIINELYQAGEMRIAKVGKKLLEQQATKIRNDFIKWINFNDCEEGTLKAYGNFLDELLEGFRRGFRLPLKRHEAHLAAYPPGSFYKKHLDQHKKQAHRQISIVAYLNEASDSHEGGGEIVLYDRAGKNILETLAPKEGAILIFLSSEVPHEVKVSHFHRHTLTAWMRDDELLPLASL